MGTIQKVLLVTTIAMRIYTTKYKQRSLLEAPINVYQNLILKYNK